MSDLYRVIDAIFNVLSQLFDCINNNWLLQLFVTIWLVSWVVKKFIHNVEGNEQHYKGE